MPRIVSVWLEQWPLTRLRRARAAPDEATSPAVVAAIGPGGLRITAVDAAARALGLRPGEPLARARARIGPGVAVHPADPEADAAALARLCLWARRYTPMVAPFGPGEGGDGFFLDVEGASHLFGGEEALLGDLAARLSAHAVPARLALADTPACAFALARHGVSTNPVVVPRGDNAPALRDLCVSALRIEPAIAESLRRLGLRRIGALAEAARPPLARRFGESLLLRLDQALGRRPEPLVSLGEPATFGASRGFLDPIEHQTIIVATAMRLMQEIAPRLAASGLGARSLRLSLHRVDGIERSLDLGLSEPTLCPTQIGRLLDLRLDRLGPALDAGFGFETVRLDVTGIGRLEARQGALAETGLDREAETGRTARLADALSQRIGARVIRVSPRASHIPERADALEPWRVRRIEMRWPERVGPRPQGGMPSRPLVLLSRSEAADEVFSLAPDGPPQRFRWRRRLHRIAHAEGPERIADAWWHAPAPTRDYYVVEDETGRRLWLYREGFHTAQTAARWFVQGLFA
ncbi:DNA polymerase Y family protein [Methylobacterium sp. W2]|uniref:DNA polymerase Y family protein n=1 Tax=Methylobacterium sp. W2 TaxID=2598107 RepID=UPI001D0C57F6|nr:DNA polymerase Y family protein [Methylobacterium sp. W2]MCC0807715.1 DNA polymerase Y family protein [Methylobacterium sp. W2]